MAPSHNVRGSLRAPYEWLLQSTRPHCSRTAHDRPIDSSNGLSIDSSIDPSIDPAAAALAPGLVSYPLRHRATVGRRVIVGSRLEAGLRRTARQIDPLAFSLGNLLEQRAADRLGGLIIIRFVGGDAFTHVEHSVLPAIRPNAQRKTIDSPSRAHLPCCTATGVSQERRKRRRAIWGPHSGVSSLAPILDACYCAEHADEFWRAEMS